ncbi:MAG: hypothetical protein ACR2IQ_01195 [Minisyncoccia bacterium]
MNSKSFKGITNVVIILVGVLIIAILVGFFRVSRPFSNIKITRPESFTLKTLLLNGTNNSSFLTGASENCDIAITSPQTGAEVSNIITISGLYRNCGWNNTDQNNFNNKATIGTVIELDGKGNNLINPLTITSNIPESFTTTLGLIRPSQTKEIVIILRNNDNQQPILLQVPVTIR